MKSLLITAFLFSAFSVQAHAVPKRKILNSKIVENVIKGVEKDMGVTCDKPKVSDIEFYKEKVNRQYTLHKFKFSVSCIDTINEIGVFINIDGTDNDDSFLIDNIRFGYAG